MKKILIILILFVFAFSAKSQVLQPINVGQRIKTLKVDTLIQMWSEGVPAWTPSKRLDTLGVISVYDKLNKVWWDWDSDLLQWKQRQGGTGGVIDPVFPNSQLRGSCAPCAFLNYPAGNNYVVFLDSVGVFFRIDDTAQYAVDNVN